jgi:FAD:protein FMN transferase
MSQQLTGQRMRSDTVVERREFRAMGSAVVVEIVGGDATHHELARTMVDHFEQCWSRFIATSDVCRLNNAGGRSISVDPATIELLVAMTTGVARTDGAFDPTLLEPLVSLGYGASWDDSSMSSPMPVKSHRASIHGVAVDRTHHVARLAPGTVVDAGGIGKGLAADMVTSALIAAGADGAMVNIGGDLRVSGEGPSDGYWLIGIADGVDVDHEVAQVALRNGGVCTSGVARRTWTDAGGNLAHHLIDPTTTAPLGHNGASVVQATVIAGDAVTAEVFTKLVMVRGLNVADHQLADQHIAVRCVLGDGSIVTNSAWATFERWVQCQPN